MKTFNVQLTLQNIGIGIGNFEANILVISKIPYQCTSKHKKGGCENIFVKRKIRR